LVVASGLGNLSLLDPMSGEVRKTLAVGGGSDAGTVYQALASQAEEQFSQMDIDKMEQDVRAAMEKQIKAMEAQSERGAKVPDKFKVEDVIKRLRQSMEEQLARMRQDFDKRKQSGSQPVARLLGSESFNCLECSPDGRLLFGATHQGVRVYSWEEIVKAADSSPPPIFSTKAESISASMGSATMSMPGSIYSVAHDAASNRLLFGGLEGKIGFLDLVSGKSGTVLDPPGRPGIISLGLSRDRASLCCACQPTLLARGKYRKPPLLQIWNYTHLARQLAEGLH
jgi:hypothetical protein